MDKELNLKKVTDSTSKYQKQLDAVDDTSKKASVLIGSVRKLLGTTLKSLIITNLKQKNGNVFYVLRITEKNIELAERNKTIESHMLFSFVNGAVFFNKKQMSPAFKTSFIERVRRILRDIEFAKANVYEEAQPVQKNATQHQPKKVVQKDVQIVQRSAQELAIEAKRKRIREHKKLLEAKKQAMLLAKQKEQQSQNFRKKLVQKHASATPKKINFLQKCIKAVKELF